MSKKTNNKSNNELYELIERTSETTATAIDMLSTNLTDHKVQFETLKQQFEAFMTVRFQV